MTAATLYFGHSQPDTPYRDASGRPLAGAVLTFWRSGTTQPAPVFTTEALTEEIEPPIVADQNGVFPDIYLSANTTYRVKLEDAQGRLMWDVDPYRLPAAPEIVLVFTANGVFDVPMDVTEVDVAVVAGGGGGGGLGGGGGGAGGVKLEFDYAVTPGAAVSVVIGEGGLAGDLTEAGFDGENSSFGALEATGGGGGGSSTSAHNGRSGGSGGGGSWDSQGGGTGGTGVPGEGHDGGAGIGQTGAMPLTYGGGGGGGAGEPGDDAIRGVRPGAGGDGIDLSGIFGTDVGDDGWFGGGGAGSGGPNVATPTNLGGKGGGGETGSSAQPNTGGGGGANGGNGGSGIVIVRVAAGAALFLSPIYQPRSGGSGGRIVPGAQLRFFKDGAIAKTYADDELSVPLSHPILADAGGYFPPIYLDSGDYVVQLKDAAGELLSGPPDNPVPVITALDPATIEAGDGQFTLTVTGAGFVEKSVVQWNGEALATTYISSTGIEATVDADDVAEIGTALVTVFNPPPAGGVSNIVAFPITGTPNPVPEISSLSPGYVFAGDPAFTLTVTGTGFVEDSVIRWDGEDRATTYISSTQLEVAIPSTDLETSGVVDVTVFNPSPGGGESAPAEFTVGWSMVEIATALWLETTDPNTITTDTGVSQWQDKSGNGRHVAQATENRQPALLAAELNGYPVIRFDGSNDVLTRGSNSLGRNVSGLGMFAVRRINDTSGAQILVQLTTATDATRAALAINSGENRVSARRNDGDSIAQIGDSDSLVADTWAIHAGVVDYTNTDGFLYINGELVASNTSFLTTGSTSNTDGQTLGVGGFGSGASNFLNGDLASVLVLHEAPNATLREKIEGYYAWRFGLVGDLPANHPYKDELPL